MFDFIIRKPVIQSAQRFIERLDPKVQVHIPEDLPMPSVQDVRKRSVIVSRINGLEEKISRLSDDQLKAKTPEFKKIYREAVAKERQEYQECEAAFKKSLDPQERENLRIQSEDLKKKYLETKKKILGEILPETFAVVRETGKRVLNMRHFDVQLIGGMVLHEGSIAEMTTGEGKTLVATLPAYLNALSGEGVHIITVNDYLAKRDREWMGPIFEFLGLSIGVITHDMMPSSRQQEYACDIVYGTNNEFGFDYLRDNMVTSLKDMVQRPHHYAIVDEVDSILVDEARTPLIISGPAEESTDKYYRANEISKQLQGKRITEKDEVDAKYQQKDLYAGVDYLADEKTRSVSLSEAGEEKVAGLFGVASLHDMETIEYRHHILQALKAKEFFKKDVDYVVRDGEVIIVDEFTGRLMPGRRWSDGLHQAVEAREGIKIERENQTLATITFQNYFRMYEKLAGMTGTAYTEANEFDQIYKLNCVVIPTNRKLSRTNYADSIYKTAKAKFSAVVKEIEELHRQGQPVLVGTISIEKSETLSRMLKQKGITHQVLNAKFHEMEAQIIAQAGRFQGVTIATNMAGRGTDIMLGGNAEFLAKNLAEEKLKDVEDEKQREESVKQFIRQFREQVQEERQKVVALGGLHVLGTERHESRRIDNQLRGRQGRQGDPGSSRFFVSLEDDLMRLFASDRIMGMMDRLGMEEDQVLEHPWLTKAIENAQKRVENHNFEIRKRLLDYDDVMNRQREVIYTLRKSILESEDIKERILGAVDETIDLMVDQYLFSQGQEGETAWDVDGLDVYLKSKFNFGMGRKKEDLLNMPAGEIKDFLIENLRAIYAARDKEFDPAQLRFVERMVFLNTIDAKWKDHLYAMDQMKEGIGLRGYGQRDPLIEYKREGFEMFQSMYSSINQEVAEIIFKVQPVAAQPRSFRGVFSSLPQNLVHNELSGLQDAASRRAASAPASAGHLEAAGAGAFSGSGGLGGSQRSVSPEPFRKSGPKVGRNDPCPCGSGKKYKKCCGK